MTITPSFQLRQSDTHIFLEISVPHIRISVEEIQLTLTEGNRQLHWYAPPIYLLVLNFAPYQFRSIEEDEENETVPADEEEGTTACHASYLPHIDHGVIRIELEKQIPNQHWENLDLLGQWKPPPPTTTSKWLQGVVTDEEGIPSPHHPSEEDDTPSRPDNILSGGFGFDRMFRENLFRDLTREGLGKEMLECPWPLTVHDDEDDEKQSIQSRRRVLRVEDYESRLFSAERYLQDLDLEDDYIYQSALSMEPHWALKLVAEESFFTSSERQLLATIPYPLLDPPVTLPSHTSEAIRHQRLCLGLLDILFAYVYDHMTTDGDPTVESAWTLFILSTSFSWCDDWLDDSDASDDEKDALHHLVPAVMRSSMRRALIYPYIRSLEFAGFIWQQVETIVRCGIRTILRCLLQARTILDKSELYYFGNKLYVDPYLIWLQQYPSTAYLESNILLPMADRIAECLGPSDQWSSWKESLGLNLIEIEMEGWAEGPSNAAGSSPNESHDESSSDGTSSSDEDDDNDDDDDESGQSVSEDEVNIESIINGHMSTIPEREEADEEHEIANDLTGDLQRLHIDGDRNRLNIIPLSPSEIQTPGFTFTLSDAKRTPLILEVD